MYKLIATSFDKTLINDEEAIPISTVFAIDNLRKQGIKFAVLTERIKQSILEYNKDLHFIDYIISCNGSHVYDVSEEKKIFAKKLTLKTLRTIKKEFETQDIHFFNDKEKEVYRNGKINNLLFEDWLLEGKEIRKIEINFDNKKKMLEGFERIKTRNLSVTCQCIVNEDGIPTIEIISNSSDKYKGLNKLLKYSQTKAEEVLVIGNSLNDLEMLKQLNNTVAVSNALQKVKRVAKHITDSNNNKGVEKAIKKYVNFI